MKRYQIILPLMALFFLFSCVDDKSAYLAQEKEDINVDNVVNEDKPEEEEEELPEGQLVPGLHLVKLSVAKPDGKTVERRFKYFMPVSINASKPISLIFEFHGSYTFKKGEKPANPIQNITANDPLAQKAIKENCVVCYPAGEVVYSADSSGTVDWHISENHLPFVDAMIDYFKGCTPKIDANRIYSTGQSSGSIFSFVLACERSTVFAAIAPRAGQMSLEGQTELPVRTVPVRLFAGEEDDIVIHSAVLTNMTTWAEKIGGYFAADMKTDTLTIKDYTSVTTRTWNGGNADIEIYSLSGVDHGVSLFYCIPYIWDFMAAHTLDGVVNNLYVTSSLKEIEARCGEAVTFSVNYTEGGIFELSNAPDGWNVKVVGKTVSLSGPKDFYAPIDRSGEMTLTVKKDGKEVSSTVRYKLIAPKDYFEVGDIYYNEDFQPAGIVCWVNKANIKEAKIVNIDQQKGILYSGNRKGLGIDFDTPDQNDGEGNTRKMVERNKTLTSPLTARDAVFMWANSYSYKNVTDWYLPAINELAELAVNLTTINEAIKALEGVELTRTLWSSTNEVKSGDTAKTLVYYDLKTKKIITKKSKEAGSEYIGYAAEGRVLKKVTK